MDLGDVTTAEFHGKMVSGLRAGPFVIRLLRSRSEAPDEEPHLHSSHHVLIPLDSGFVSDAWGYEQRLGRDPIIYTPAKWEHRDSMRRLHGRFATISLDPASSLAGAGLPNHSVAISHPHLLSLAHTIIAASLSERPALFRMEALCTELFYQVEASARAEEKALPSHRRAIERLAQGPPFPRIADLAADAGMSPGQFAHSFRRVLGCRPNEWRAWTQTARAAALIRGGEPNLADVALMSGHADQSHLGRRFRRLFRCSPAAYGTFLSRARE